MTELWNFRSQESSVDHPCKTLKFVETFASSDSDSEQANKPLGADSLAQRSSRKRGHKPKKAKKHKLPHKDGPR